jgi:hypothetical protein
MTGKEYHMLQQLVEHFEMSAKQCYADAEVHQVQEGRNADVGLQNKGDGFLSCADRLKRLLASMNS